MNEYRSLYKRAGNSTNTARPIWQLGPNHMFFISPLRYNGVHQHGAPVYLPGVYGPFQLRIDNGEWLSCHAAIIPAGLAHELDVHGEPIAGLYVEPRFDGVHALTPLVRDPREIDGALVGKTGDYVGMRELWEDQESLRWVDGALDDLLHFARRRAKRDIDPRIGAAMDYLVAECQTRIAVAGVAAQVGLSASRFQQLFTRLVGVAYRRYCAWCRMREAISAIVTGDNFTTAAYSAGFADQSHLNHDFKQTFGAPPSVSLRRIRGMHRSNPVPWP